MKHTHKQKDELIKNQQCQIESLREHGRNKDTTSEQLRTAMVEFGQKADQDLNELRRNLKIEGARAEFLEEGLREAEAAIRSMAKQISRLTDHNQQMRANLVTNQKSD